MPDQLGGLVVTGASGYQQAPGKLCAETRGEGSAQ